ncbi:MAG: DUF4386 domain-containing protein [Bacteroidetes bacterium]|nr:MAG: DUF4386 domain-containing protein [Bacteroidota bacterium]
MQINSKTLSLGGAMYLLIFIGAFFSEGAIRGTMFLWDDSAATVDAIQNSSRFFQIGILGDLTAFIADVFISILFFYLLKPVGSVLAATLSALRLIAHPAIGISNLLFQFQAGNLAIHAASFSDEQVAELTMNAAQTHHIGYLLAGAMFGVHCFLLGYAMYKSGFFHKGLAILMLVAGITYVLETYGSVIWPNQSEMFSSIVMLFAVVAEIWLLLWLLIPAFRKKYSSTIVQA